MCRPVTSATNTAIAGTAITMAATIIRIIGVVVMAAGTVTGLVMVAATAAMAGTATGAAGAVATVGTAGTSGTDCREKGASAPFFFVAHVVIARSDATKQSI